MNMPELEPFDFKTASESDLKKEYDRIASEMIDDQYAIEIYFTMEMFENFKELPSILQDGEQVLAFCSGYAFGKDHACLVV